MKICGIYSITCVSNNKIYIGSTRNYKKRCTNHKRELRKNSHHNQHMQNAWNTHGSESFVFSLLENCDLDISRADLEAKEKEWILKYSSHKREFGFNKTFPGTIPLRGEDENKTSLGRGGALKVEVVHIDMYTKEIREFSSISDAGKFIGITPSKANNLVCFWNNKKHGKKHHKGNILVRKNEYKPDFDYIKFNRRCGRKKFTYN